MKAAKRTRSSRRRGVTVVLVAVMLVVMLGFTALTIDIGFLYTVHAETQDGADAAALAGASGLLDEPAVCRARATETALLNTAALEAIVLSEDQIELGHWDWMDASFTVLEGSDEEQANAVRVVAERGEVPYFFASLFGIHQFDVTREAIGHRVPPCGGVWGIEGVSITGDAYTDSYRSTETLYSFGIAEENGDVCSNRNIEVIGSAIIHGDTSPGQEYELILQGNAEITGSNSPGETLTDIPGIDLTAVTLANDNASIGLTDLGREPFFHPGPNDLYVSGGPDNLTLAPGTYLFDSITVRSQATLTVTGPTTIYVTGDVHMGGGAIVNVTQDPHNLTIYSTGESFELHGGTGFYGTVYAPNTDLSLIGNSSYYGALVARTIDIGGTAQIHVDETLPLLIREQGPQFLVR